MIDAFIFDAVRTPRGIGKPHGALHEVKPILLLEKVMEALRERNAIDTKDVNDLFLGCATPVRDQGGNIAKAALIHSGWEDSVPGIQLNRLCGSGLEAVNFAAMKIRAGWGNLVVAGGLESLSRVPMGSDGGPLFFDPKVVTKTGYIPQGVSADLIASIEGFSREELDAFALRSQQNAFHAQENGYFDKSIVPVLDRNGLTILDKDETLRPDTTSDSLAELSPSFKDYGEAGFNAAALRKYPFLEKINHIHTAGNSSRIVDGAALVLVGTKGKGEEMGIKPRAKILSAVTVSVEPTIMLTGYGPAAERALFYAGLKAEDIDLWEVNESFAGPVLKFMHDMNIPEDKLNVNGGCISLGHPLGATGAMLIGTLIDELERRDLETGLVSIAGAGGVGIATVIQRV